MENGFHAFNCLYKDFIAKLQSFFPNVYKLQFYRELFHQFRSSDYKLPARLFLSSVASHSVHIFNRNDEYFMSGIEVIKTRERAIIETTIIQEWKNMSDEQRDTVWFYLQQMLIVLMNETEQDYTGNEAEKNAELVLRKAFRDDGVFKP